MSYFKKMVLISCAVTLTTWSYAARGESNTLTKATDVLLREYFASPEQFRTADQRIVFVNRVKDYCAEVALAFPKNSPAEEKWLEQESAGSVSSERHSRAIGSPEYGRKMADNFASGCSIWAANYIEGKNRSFALAGLAYVFATFQPGAEYSATQNNLNARQFGFWGMNTITRSILVAAMLEATPSAAD